MKWLLLMWLHRYGIYTEPPEVIKGHLSYGCAVVQFLDELWVETATIVAVANGSSKKGVIDAMMNLVTRPPHNPGGEWLGVHGCGCYGEVAGCAGATYKNYQPCIPKCDTKSEQQFNEFFHEVTQMRNKEGAWLFRIDLDGQVPLHSHPHSPTASLIVSLCLTQADLQGWDFSTNHWDMCKTLWLTHGELHGYGHQGVFGPHRLFYIGLLQRCAHHLNFYKIEARPDNMVRVAVSGGGGCEWL